MTRETITDDWLDAALAADAAEHRAAHIDDAGFTQRVMVAMPPAVQMPAWRGKAVVALWAAAGVAAAFVLPGAFVDVAREGFRLLGGHAVSLSGLGAAIAACAVATWAATAYALRD